MINEKTKFNEIKKVNVDADKVQHFNDKVVEINGQLLEIKINLAKGFLTSRDAQMFASVLEQQLKQLLLANRLNLSQDKEYQNSLKLLKTELQSLSKSQTQSLDNVDNLEVVDKGLDLLPDSDEEYVDLRSLNDSPL